MRVLIIYENFPESPNLYLVDDPSEEYLKLFEVINNRILDELDETVWSELNAILLTRATKLDRGSDICPSINMVIYDWYVIIRRVWYG